MTNKEKAQMIQDVWHPVRGSRHLLAENFQRHFLGTFND